jgi:hypothetical protein
MPTARSTKASTEKGVNRQAANPFVLLAPGDVQQQELFIYYIIPA